MTNPLIRERVEAGAATLDTTAGVNPGWRHDINLTKLNLDSVWRCVLGQLFGDYETGAGILGFTPYGSDETVANGFMSDWDGYELTEAWREYLEETT